MPIPFALRAMACLIFIGIAAMNIAVASIARAVKLTPDIAPYFAESIGALVLSPYYKQALPVGQ